MFFFSFYFWFERSFFLRSSFREKELEVFLKLLVFFQLEFVSISEISKPKSKFGYPWKWLAARQFVGGSGIGGIKETQEMLDFCGEHNITCMIEKIPISYINTTLEKLEKRM
jgi:D-arabinose 1-dehydrogenase-like Zn-dependent alcohol dehydrogenase